MQFLPGSIEIENEPYDLQVWRLLVEFFSEFEGCCAYKIPILGANDLEEVPSFIVFTKFHGLLLIDVFPDCIERVSEDGRFWKSNQKIHSARDAVIELYSDEIESRFKKSALLYDRKSKKVKVPFRQYILALENSREELEALSIQDYLAGSYSLCGKEEYKSVIEKLSADTVWEGSNEQLDDIFSLLEGTWKYNGDLGLGLPEDPLNTMNALIRKSLDRTFKQDNSQRQVSMQIPNGPQRIRGLAGTGKTVVLCLKAALTLLRMKQYRVLYLFNTQSLYQLIENNIEDYYVKESKSSLPKSRIDILHAWGGRTTGDGLYSKTCKEYGINPMTLREVPWGVDALEFIYKDLLKKIADKIEPVYDMVLIDEAQDFPNQVFELAYLLTKEPKRIVIAYDDFQSLSSLKIREFSELFGQDKEGKPRVPAEALEGDYAGGIAKDFVLPNCYRNPRNVLMVAHGIALGVKREGGVVDSVDKKKDWEALGYSLLLPKKDSIEAGDEVIVERADKNSTNLLERLIAENEKKTDNLVQVDSFASKDQEVDFIVQKIKQLVHSQGVRPHDIYVITLNTKQSDNYLRLVRTQLNNLGIKAISPGFIESARNFHKEDNVVLTTAYRAKGNEANIVFVMSCEGVARDLSFMKRNSFFVSVTRSRGWCYITGVGDGMEVLEREIRAIQNEIPRFQYVRPSDEQIARRRLILSNADSESEKQQKLLEEIIRKNPEMVKELISQQELFNGQEDS